MLRLMTEPSKRRRRARRGLTLAELLVSTTIMLLIATAMAMLAMTVHSTNDYCRGQLDCAQHARIVLQIFARKAHRVEARLVIAGKLLAFLVEIPPVIFNVEII